MRIALYGGTFDPVHDGHLAVIRAILDAGLVDRVLVMPAGLPPHKRGEVQSFAAYRLEMLRRALRGMKHVKVDDREIRRDGPSYTVDTLEALIAEGDPEDQWFLLVGADMLLNLPQWHRYERILELATVAVAQRPGYGRDEVRDAIRRMTREDGATVETFDSPAVDRSSTELRVALHQGRMPSEGLPAPVADMIRTLHLYRQDKLLDALSDQAVARLHHLERELFRYLSPGRIVHVLNVMFLCLRYALYYGADPEAATLAGLLHDSAKQLPIERQRAWAKPFPDRDPALLADPILHGPAASVMLPKVMGIRDPRVLGAIAYHSTLDADPDLYTMILYLADKIEPGRDFPDLDPIRREAEQHLEPAVLMTIDGQEAGLARHGQHLLPRTETARARLEAAVAEHAVHRAAPLGALGPTNDNDSADDHPQ